MAGGPYKTTDGWYYCRWSDKAGHPEQPKKTESLKTKKKSEADTRLSILETLQGSGYHRPWELPWHENGQINHIVLSGHLDLKSLANNLRSKAGATLSGMVEDYIAYKKRLKGKRGWGQRMMASAPYVLRDFAAFVGPNLHPDRVEDLQVQDFLYRKDITSDHTRASYLTKIKACFNWGIQQHYTTNKITYQTDTPQEEIPAFLSDTEIRAICAWHINETWKNLGRGFTQADNTRLWMPYAWMILASTGMRPSELMEIDIDSGIQGNNFVVGASHVTKVRKQRIVPFMRYAKYLVPMLLDPKVRAKDRWMRDSRWLFGRHGRQAQRYLSDDFRAARQAILPHKDIPCYKLKDSFAVWYLTNSTELAGNTDRRLYELMRILGHAKLSTTQIYLKAVPLATQLE